MNAIIVYYIFTGEVSNIDVKSDNI